MSEKLQIKIEQATNDAISQFGEYNFWDKGPREVMEVEKLTEELNALPVEQCREVLLNLINGNDYTKRFVEAALIVMQDIPDERWEFLMEEPKIAEAFV